MNPIYIHKGDCTIFADCRRFLTFNIETDLDLTGWKAKFILGWITKEIEDISSKSFDIVLGSEDTKQLRLGSQNASIILTDAEGHVKTLANNIPFEVTTAVVENEYQEIDLTIPQSSGVDILLKVGAKSVTSVNGMTGDVVLNIPSLDGYVTEQQLQEGLDSKQPVGEYATPLDIMQAIAAIPQFKLSIVSELPLAGEKMTLYLIPKQGTDNDVYNEYIWIEETGLFEFLGTTAVDLTEYVKKTDYAGKGGKAGVFVPSTVYGIRVDTSGYLTCFTFPLDKYESASGLGLICKNTLENVLTQYSKTVSITQADYDALQTKDSNTLYLIEE